MTKKSRRDALKLLGGAIAAPHLPPSVTSSASNRASAAMRAAIATFPQMITAVALFGFAPAHDTRDFIPDPARMVGGGWGKF